ncbi:MAG TPA: biotin/lipoyl-binding protein, partial [Planctomycetota bacterium]|nr:biotin/lipoyl-binding protein [Planctomycetota bacterium]
MSAPDLSVLARGARDSVESAPVERTQIPEPPFRWKTRVLLPGAVLACFSVLLLYAARDTLLPSTPVRVATVVPSQGGASSGSVSFQAAGWVEPDPYPVYVTTLTDGIVREVPVMDGQKVKAGDVVVRLVDDDAKLALARAEAEVKQREAELKSAEAVLTAAQQEWDNPIERVRAVAIAEAELAAYSAELHQNCAQIDLEQARADELVEQLKREKSAGEALPEFQRVQTELKLKTQLAAIEMARKEQPLHEAHVKQQQAEVAAAKENLKLRI